MAIPLGFTVVTSSTELRAGKIRVRCWRSSTRGSGKEDSLEHSTKTNCPFQLFLRRPCDSYDAPWSIRLSRDYHNHPRDFPIDMPIARRFTSDEKERILREKRAPAEILAMMNDEGRATRPHDLSNLFAKQKRMELAGSSPAEAAIKLLDANDDLYYTWIDEDTSRMTGLLLSSHAAAALSRLSCTVLIIDSTYSTNRYGLPCLHIVTKTGVGKLLTSCVVVMGAETAVWYNRAMEKFLQMVLLGKASLVHCIVTDREAALKTAIEKHFPAAKHHYCQWHICCNITSNGRNKMPDALWDKVLDEWKTKVMWATTVEGAKNALVEMKRK